MAKSNASGLLTSLDSLFTTQEQRDAAKRDVVLDLPLDQIGDFPNHPFKVRQDEAMMEMMESVQLHGVLVPGLVRQLADGSYQMVSGHRRKLASRLAGLDTLPCIVRDLTDDEAIIVMVDSNLQREKVLPSEKAFAYKMKMEALKNQGKRTDLTLSQVATKLDAAAEIGKSADESRDQVFRYIRLTHLIPDILKLVDEGKIALTPAVELSYLQPSEQEMLFSVMDSDEVTPSLSQARRLRRMSEAQTLTDDAVLQLLSEVKGNQVEYVKVPVDKLRSFFRPDTSVKQMTETLVKAMDFYWRGSAETGTPGERRLAMTKMEIQTLYEVMFTDYPDIVNVAQVQAMLGISRHLAYALIGDGDIPGMKIGNAYRVPKINVIRYALSAGNPQPAA